MKVMFAVRHGVAVEKFYDRYIVTREDSINSELVRLTYEMIAKTIESRFLLVSRSNTGSVQDENEVA